MSMQSHVSTMRFVSTILLSALLMGCAATGAPEDIQGRLDYVAGVEFGWSPIGKPVVDGPLAGFVAYNKARQKVLGEVAKENQVEGGYGLTDRVLSAQKAELAAMVPDGQEPTEEQEIAAFRAVRKTLTPEQQALMDSQVDGMYEFASVFAEELLKAGAAAVGAEVVKEILSDVGGLTQGMDYLAGIKAASQIGSFMDQVDAAVEIDSLLGFFENTKAMWEAAAIDA